MKYFTIIGIGKFVPSAGLEPTNTEPKSVVLPITP